MYVARDYKEGVKKYEKKEKHRKEQGFSRLGSATAEAEYDINLFLRKYFLDSNGKPDNGKTPKPITLPGYENQAAMHSEVERLGIGFETVSGDSRKHRTTCIGWDRGAVRQLAHHFDLESEKRQKTTKEKQSENILVAHKDYAMSKVDKGLTPRSLTLNGLTGSYVVECNAITSHWDSEMLTLDIMKPDNVLGVTAAFDFGILEGTMLLSLSKSDLDKYVAEHEEEEVFSNSENEADHEVGRSLRSGSSQRPVVVKLATRRQ